ncbi:MAG: ribosome biogenesis GTP-binding protein YihA/YsxC [Proteobacteria bacterium]|nr:ribosome biogenesis GTP-binding protein YihA/YsxC [Pseudomonadota bacterium]
MGPENDSVSTEDEPDVKFGHWLFAQECEFVRGATAPDEVPDSDLPEIAFAGRSNVGKSSLVNALTGRSTLARTSNQPGRTQQLNFFRLGNRLMMTDLPGYGYAKAPRHLVEQWTAFTRSYLRGRPQLRRTCLLIDSRHGLKTVDREAMTLLDETAVIYQIVLTKCDKIKAGALDKLLAETAQEAAGHTAAHPTIIPTSAKNGTGIAELRAMLAALAAADDIS